MQFYRMAGALILACSGFGAALAINSKLSHAMKQTDALTVFLCFVRSQIECFSLPASEIISMFDKELLRGCGFCAEVVPSDMRSLIYGFEVDDAEARSIIRRFADSFGQGYREEQIKECDYYIELLRERRQALAQTLPAKKKVNCTLCISSALALIILLL